MIPCVYFGHEYITTDKLGHATRICKFPALPSAVYLRQVMDSQLDSHNVPTACCEWAYTVQLAVRWHLHLLTTCSIATCFCNRPV